ncbi:MAG: iron transporter FeoA [Omnitrophica bacterium GWA2_52_8]|nr:MAG: iron transporter FeoA [Omnitrophica bacterium GWA2_52_8]
MVLSQLKPSQTGVVQGYEGENDLYERLMELGIVPGTEILVKRYAPFGDPMEVIVRGYRISIRKKDAQQILVALKERA